MSKGQSVILIFSEWKLVKVRVLLERDGTHRAAFCRGRKLVLRSAKSPVAEVSIYSSKSKCLRMFSHLMQIGVEKT